MIRAVALLVAGLLSVAPVGGDAVEAQAPGCDVESATLTWGFKESFRAYLDGSIANGGWTVADGATYDTPTFGFASEADAGRVDPRVPSGSVGFAGSIRFTGHGGILDTTVSNPTLEFSQGGAVLRIDVEGPTMEGDPVSVEQTRFLDVDLDGQDLTPVDGVIAIVDAPTALRAEGSEAFPNYPAGEAFDPLNATIDVPGCDLAAQPAPGDASETGAPTWIAWLLLGGAAIVVAALLAWVLVLTRRRP